eukprot:TRINITY_DN9314_c0_g1_i1.p1 TRINITY_DN9314_c0_g1~~TRINITY_DN9314_c0_g1_i1.p1  ORF type:complete len:587 (-),score=94.39 TRINITY_DN9314_c0_g1_i1:13-1773(-)
MNTNPFTELEEELRCSLCLELFTEPRTLPCGHTYCTMCLQDVYRKSTNSNWLVCPLCREKHLIEVMGILSFPKNFHIASIVDKVKSLSTNQNLQNSNAISPQTQPLSNSNNVAPPMNNVHSMEMHDVNPSAPPIIEEEFHNHNVPHPQPMQMHQPYYPPNTQPYIYPYPTTYQFSPIQSTNTNMNPHPVTQSQVLPYPVDYSAAVDRNTIDADKKRQMEYDELLATSLQFGDDQTPHSNQNAPNISNNGQTPLEFPVVNPFDKPATSPKSPNNNVHNTNTNNNMNMNTNSHNTNTINTNNTAYPGSHSTNNFRPVNRAEFASLRYGDFMTQLSDVAPIISEWAHSIWFAPASFAKDIRLGPIQAAMAPYYIFDVKLELRFTAEVNTVGTRDWRPITGRRQGQYAKLLANAVDSSCVHHRLIVQGDAEFDLSKLEVVNGVGGWLWKGINKLLGAEQDNKDKNQPPKNALVLGALPYQTCWQTVMENIKTSELTKVEIDLRNDKKISGIRNIEVKIGETQLIKSLVYFPVYLTSYAYQTQVYLVVVNAQNGQVYADRPHNTMGKMLDLTKSGIEFIANLFPGKTVKKI